MLELILLSLGLSCATGVLSLVASKARAASKTIACVGGMGAAALSFAGGIGAALDRCHSYLKEKGLDLKIEIEVRSFDEIRQVMAHGGVDRIMFDNFSVDDTRKAVAMIGGKYETESSGGITFDTIRDYAECGVDFISVGALTHSVKGLDMSFKAC